jgi:hypothetical protein
MYPSIQFRSRTPITAIIIIFAQLLTGPNGVTGVQNTDYVTINTSGRLGRGNISSRRYKHDIRPMDKASESIFALAGPAMAQAPTLTSSGFYGGAGDQRGTAIAVGGGGLYISGNVQPETQSPSDTALVLRYALPSGPSPIWARSYDFGTDFFGIAATNEAFMRTVGITR